MFKLDPTIKSSPSLAGAPRLPTRMWVRFSGSPLKRSIETCLAYQHAVHPDSSSPRPLHRIMALRSAGAVCRELGPKGACRPAKSVQVKRVEAMKVHRLACKHGFPQRERPTVKWAFFEHEQPRRSIIFFEHPVFC